MPIDVLSAGLSTTVQDLGRPGYYHLGIPIGGAMDRHALRAANLLVGNREDAACLEAVFLGPELAFSEDAVAAVTGAELPPKVDGAVKSCWPMACLYRSLRFGEEYLPVSALLVDKT